MRRFCLYALVLGLLVVGCGSGKSDLIGKPAPDFQVSPAKAGGDVRLVDFKGKVVVLDFWATWCGPCRALMPYVSKLQEKYRDQGLVVLGISAEEHDLVSQFRLANPWMQYELFSDHNAEASMLYKADGLPTTVIVGRDGKVRYWENGVSEQSVNELEDEVKEALKQ